MITWPERPLCHGDVTQGAVFRFGEPRWRDPEPTPRRYQVPGYLGTQGPGGLKDDDPPEGVHPGPCGYPFRKCSYCGSIHPGDLYEYLNTPRREGPCVACDPRPSEPISPKDREPTADEIAAWRKWNEARWARHSCRVTLGGSDWKYGWPHKFYVEGIPNPIAGQPCIISRTYRGGTVTLDEPRPAGSFTHAKFYNEHLLDLAPEAFRALVPLIADATGIRFTIEDGKLRYAAPCWGYQQ